VYQCVELRTSSDTQSYTAETKTQFCSKPFLTMTPNRATTVNQTQRFRFA